MTSFRLLKIAFVVLLLVMLGEIGYYVYYQFNLSARKTAGGQKVTGEKAIRPDVIKFLSQKIDEPNVKTYITTETDTKVIKVWPKGLDLNNVRYPYAFSIRTKRFPNGMTLYLTQFMLDRLKIFEIRNNTEILGTLDDLTAGKNIKIIDTYDGSVAVNEEGHVKIIVIKIYEDSKD